GEKETQLILFPFGWFAGRSERWPTRRHTSLSLARSQIDAALSRPAEAASLPSGDSATEWTKCSAESPCVGGVFESFPDARSHARGRRAMPPESAVFPSRETATE